MKKKNLLFTTYDLRIGGVEKVLVNLLNNLDTNKYNVTLYLQFREGEFLGQLKPEIKVKDYNLSKCKNILIRKLVNGFKFISILIRNFRKYDFACCFGSGYIPSARLALAASSNNAAWLHTNILNFMKNNDYLINLYHKDKTIEEKCKRFINSYHFRKFDNLIFVSEDAKNAYLSLYEEDINKVRVIRNLIDYEYIISNAGEEIEYKKDKTVFLNVSRHSEYDKRITRLIEACKKLKKDYSFELLLVGGGEETENYKKLVNKYKLNDYIKFVGFKTNPFPYYKIADAFVLCSQFEGFPTTFIESMVMNVPIITTKVSDALSMIDNKYGIVVDNNDEAIYDGMKKFLDEGFKIKKKFDYKKYNNDSLNELEKMFNGE